jgi:ATP-dependent Clp protease ATP-binding subunit ClpA
LQRVIDKEIKMPLARELLFGKLKDGGNLTIDIVDNTIALKVDANEVVEQA